MKSGGFTGDQTIQGGTGKFTDIEGTAPLNVRRSIRRIVRLLDRVDI
jgi:hypothetical protein